MPCVLRVASRCVPIGLALTFSGCSASSNVELAVRPDGGNGGNGGIGGNGGRDAVAPSDAPSDQGGSEVTGPLAPVRLGLVPIATSSAEAGQTVIDSTVATLDVLATGSRGVSMIHRWDALYSSADQPITSVWTALAQAAPLFRESDRSILFSIALVDREEDARPAGLTGAWDSPATRLAAERLIDRAFGTFGGELAYLTVGSEVDRFLSAASPTDKAGFVALAKHCLDYARAHGNRPSQTRVGVVSTLDRLVDGAAEELVDLVSRSDVVVATYYPLDADFSAKPPAGAAGDLDDLVTAVSGDADATEVVLQEVGYPSSDVAGASEDKQLAFFDGFFQALSSRRDRFPFVSIYALNDRDVTACEAEAAALGAPGDPIAIAARCSMGIRHADGTPKAAWSSVLGGIATFATP